MLALVCPKCGGEMRIIAFINGGPVIREILGHLGEPTSAPRITPARGPPLWELKPSGKPIHKHNRRRTTSLINASPGRGGNDGG